MLPMYSASTLWKQTLRQLVSVAFCWDQNFTLSPITTRVGLGLCRLELRNSVVFVFLWNILCGCAHKSIVQLCSFLTSWAASIFRVSQRIKMCAGRIGDFQAIGYPGSFSLNFSLRSALLLEEKERCEEVTEEMEQVHSCAWKEARSRGRQGPHSSAEVSLTITLSSGRGGSNTVVKEGSKEDSGEKQLKNLSRLKSFFWGFGEKMLNGIVTQEQAKIQKLRLNYLKLSKEIGAWPARMQTVSWALVIQLQHQLQAKEEVPKMCLTGWGGCQTWSRCSKGGTLSTRCWRRFLTWKLVTISRINLLIRTLAFRFKMPSVHAADYFQVVDNFGCPEGLMRAVEQSAGGKLFHHVVESDKVAAGILKEVNRIKLPGGFTLPNKIDSFRPMQRPAVGNWTGRGASEDWGATSGSDWRTWEEDYKGFGLAPRRKLNFKSCLSLQLGWG